MRFGKIGFDPAHNPAILDTAAWDEAAAVQMLAAVDADFWRAAREAGRSDATPPAGPVTLYPGSAAVVEGSAWFLAGLPDAQQLFVAIGPERGESPPGPAIATIPVGPRERVAAYLTDAAIIDRYCRTIRPDKGPQPLAAIPRLGIGARMSAAMWPGVYRAMDQGRFAANTIQNSVRELELLENILAGKPPEAIYYPGFGVVEAGHTGATFEGLWTYGVLEALKSDGRFRYGADADHIKVLPGPAGLDWARHVLECARYYSFFTLDVSAVLDYAALAANAGAAEEYLTSRIPDAGQRRALLAYHAAPRKIGGSDYRLDGPALGRLVGKYWEALAAAEALAGHIARLKNGRPFDLEFAIDERSPDVETCACITADEEVAFVLLEAQRRGLRFTHVAPNFGVEKGVDYRCGGGLAELESRVRSQHRIAEEFDVLLDFHSGDDLSSATCQVIGRATNGRNHFKIAPEPQMLFAKTVRDFYPDLFRRWWEESLAYARREAAAGSQFAADCIRQQEAAGQAPSPADPIFHNFGFGFVGRRGPDGAYLNRETLYSLSPEFYRAYQDRLFAYLCALAEDLFDPGT